MRDFLSILELVKPRKGEVFVDLGSGTGKAVLVAACGFPGFSKVPTGTPLHEELLKTEKMLCLPTISDPETFRQYTIKT